MSYMIYDSSDHFNTINTPYFVNMLDKKEMHSMDNYDVYTSAYSSPDRICEQMSVFQSRLFHCISHWLSQRNIQIEQWKQKF